MQGRSWVVGFCEPVVGKVPKSRRKSAQGLENNGR